MFNFFKKNRTEKYNVSRELINSWGCVADFNIATFESENDAKEYCREMEKIHSDYEYSYSKVRE